MSEGFSGTRGLTVICNHCRGKRVKYFFVDWQWRSSSCRAFAGWRGGCCAVHWCSSLPSIRPLGQGDREGRALVGCGAGSGQELRSRRGSRAAFGRAWPPCIPSLSPLFAPWLPSPRWQERRLAGCPVSILVLSPTLLFPGSFLHTLTPPQAPQLVLGQ